MKRGKYNRTEERKKIIKDLNLENSTKIVIFPRYCPEEFESISTTKLIEKIKNC